jgi:hypothetical protein
VKVQEIGYPVGNNDKLVGCEEVVAWAAASVLGNKHVESFKVLRLIEHNATLECFALR